MPAAGPLTQLGGEPARAGSAADAIDGIQPGVVVSPRTARGVALALEAASKDGRATVIRGAGTRLAWGRPPARLDVVLEMTQLERVVRHREGDLTVTVDAATPVEVLNARLRPHRQWLPCDTWHAEATIGGLLATNDSGPLRHRFGTPRDRLIGIELATTDGRLIKAGGEVVKNVAGYDLGKLVCGSHGSLAAIVAATFKLAPTPDAGATVEAAFDDAGRAASAAAAVAASQLEPMALDLRATFAAGDAGGDDLRVLVRVSSTPRAVDALVSRATALMNGAPVSVLTDAAEIEAWRAGAAELWARPGAVARVSCLPAALGDVLRRLGELSRALDVDIELVVRAGIVAGLLRIHGPLDRQVQAIERLREPAFGLRTVVVLRGEAALKVAIDVWGTPSSSAPLSAAIKRAFDPAGILSPGRGPV